MGWLKLVMVAVLVWGNSVFASLPDASGGAREELQTVSSWMAQFTSDTADSLAAQYDSRKVKDWMTFLNQRVPNLNVTTDADLEESHTRGTVIMELHLLEGTLRGAKVAPSQDYLMKISCSHPVCGE
jgi:hypothetical protein